VLIINNRRNGGLLEHFKVDMDFPNSTSLFKHAKKSPKGECVITT